jgi:hypothetical protein
MKTAMSIIITIGIFLLAVIAVLAISQPVHAGGDHHPPVSQPQPTSSVPIAKKKDHRWQVPILVIGVAGVVCWFYCDDKPKDEPLPDFGPVVITPDNLKDKPRKFLIEAE